MMQDCEHHPKISVRVRANFGRESDTDVVVVNHLQKVLSTASSAQGVVRLPKVDQNDTQCPYHTSTIPRTTIFGRPFRL